MVGLYGVIALHVGQRRREIGVRMALGARATDVLRLLLGEGLRITLVGVALGLAGAFATSRALRALVYGTSAADPAVFGAAALGVALVSLLATYLPARRAALVDPTVSLRAD
jgi:ABC-type antimicrobial peptide transport system permease subunit